MPASLGTTLNGSMRSLSRTETLLNEALTLPASLQRIAGEILLLRAATILENAIADAIRKLICGATYIDGTQTANMITARSIAHADDLIRTYGRKKPAGYTKWLFIPSIKEGVKFILVNQEHCIDVLDKFSNEINDIRVIRNHIAHNNGGTKKEYRKIIDSYYGSNIRLLPCGTMLMSKNISSQTMIRRHIVAVRAIVRDITKA